MALFQDIHKNRNTVIIVTHEEDVAAIHTPYCTTERWGSKSDERNQNPNTMKIYLKKEIVEPLNFVGGTRVAKKPPTHKCVWNHR